MELDSATKITGWPSHVYMQHLKKYLEIQLVLKPG